MFSKLQDNNKFKQDLVLFNNALDQCPKDYYKTLESLILQFRANAKKIDDGHDGYAGGYMDLRTLIDAKFLLTDTRTKIFNLLRKLKLDK